MPQYNITNLDKAIILKNFFNLEQTNSGTLFMGYLSPGLVASNTLKITTTQAQNLLKESKFIDEPFGKTIKINLGSNILSTDLYDDRYGEDAGKEAMCKALLEMGKIRSIDEVKLFKTR